MAIAEFAAVFNFFSKRCASTALCFKCPPLNYIVFLLNTRFKEGLSWLGVLQAVENHADAMEPMFVYHDEPLDAAFVESIFIIDAWSEAGSNRYKAELKTQRHWLDLLQDMEGMQTFVRLLSRGSTS